MCGPRRRPSLPAPLLTAGPRRRPTRRKSAGGRARGPGLLREALQSGGLPNGGKAQARVRTRERARGRRTGGPGLTGSEFGDARPSARANQIAARGTHLRRACVGAWSVPPSPRRWRVSCPAPGSSCSSAGVWGGSSLSTPSGLRWRSLSNSSCQVAASSPGLGAPNREDAAQGEGLVVQVRWPEAGVDEKLLG